MITRAVVVPHPPLLVPELVAGAAAQTAAVRDACLAATGELARHARDWIAIGAASAAAVIEPGVRASFRGFGVDVPVALSDGVAPGQPADLPLPALVAGWLRERAGARSVRVELVPFTASQAECVALGERLSSVRDDVGLLVLGDGSNRHETAPPGWTDARASDFDGKVAAALAGADPEALLAVDHALAAELGVQGLTPWWVLAGLARAAPHWRGRLLYSDAPLGVAYHVAAWERR
ncbi:hypothetical protein [Prauserella muralis]|uniref:Uncharacterized protein n=1 Tax=Prauserella muralis TaxID=588067 RepID=A0A2V4AI01_9PSEU|nr:hypothetical protein [Prauserella muralis]PXY19572.1 hypothetical protein BAY60_33140 [Prauserella muralis]TWE29567.1 catalytic LigB subunit of aromatic ring-opening dioxygenase [Prauserella muralis]